MTGGVCETGGAGFAGRAPFPFMPDTASAVPILHVENVSRAYPTAAGELTVLRGASFSLEAGESLALVGPSGSGKTTLLGLCAGLDQPTTGTISLAGP